MGSNHPLSIAWNRTPPRLVLPRRLLKDLIVSQQIGIGSRVLDAGCGRGELVRFLDYLSIDAVGLDDSAEAIAEARRESPQRRFYLAQPADELPLAEHQFDLVLVRSLGVYRQNLLDLRLRHATANLLACVRPGGSLAFIVRHEGADAEPVYHRPQCVTQHVSCFPVTVQVTFFADQPVRRHPLRRLWRRKPAPGYFTIVVQTPRVPLPRTGWQDYGAQGAGTLGTCCEWAAPSSVRDSAARRVA